MMLPCKGKIYPVMFLPINSNTSSNAASLVYSALSMSKAARIRSKHFTAPYSSETWMAVHRLRSEGYTARQVQRMLGPLT
jgi:hypothetical protein